MKRLAWRSIGKDLPGRLRSMLAERLAPSQAASAVFVGVALGIVPIYGAQSIVALALASALRLNRPLTLAATFINNPLLQPILVVSSVQLGHRALHGRWVPLTVSGLSTGGLKEQVGVFLVGSFMLAALLASALALLTFVAFSWRLRVKTAPAPSDRRRAFEREVRLRYATAPARDRNFARWKVRLDRMFDTLLAEELASGAAVDLGCGYGLALLALSFKSPDRPLFGCDLDGRRIAAARIALSDAACTLQVSDAATTEIPTAGLVLIIDVLQYFDRQTQARLLTKCADALVPSGQLVFRVPESRPSWTTTATAALDRLIFSLGGAGKRPTHLSAEVYRGWLADLGFTVRELHHRNRLPLSHVVFLATKGEPANA